MKSQGLDIVCYFLGMLCALAAVGICCLGCGAESANTAESAPVSTPSVASTPIALGSTVTPKVTLPMGTGLSGWWRTPDGELSASIAQTDDNWVYGSIHVGDWDVSTVTLYDITVQLYSDGLYRGTAQAWSLLDNALISDPVTIVLFDDVMHVALNDLSFTAYFERTVRQ